MLPILHLHKPLMTPVANGTTKTVAIWTMTDEHGEIEIRDWSGANYRDTDYVDKTLRLRRIRIHALTTTPVKIGEFVPGRNGTKIINAPRAAMLKWWLGDNYNPELLANGTTP